MQTVQEIASGIRELKGKRVLVASHVNPDGDAVGSMAAFAHMAEAQGAEVRVLLVSGLPREFSWLHMPWPVANRLKDLGEFVPEVLLVVDCGDAGRCGAELEAFFYKGVMPTPDWKDVVSFNIDHHVSNPLFATFNLVNPESAATAELAGLVARELGMALSGPLGESIFTGLVTDTGNFTFTNTTSDVLAMAAEIVAAGLDVGSTVGKIENRWSIDRMHLWGYLISNLQVHAGGTVACSVLSLEEMARFKATANDLEGYASFMRHLEGLQVSIVVRECGPGKSKLSMRSTKDVNVQRITSHFGGGGHKAAAGADVELPPELLCRKVLDKLQEEYPEIFTESA